MIMSIIGPRETHDYRNYNLLVLGINSSQKKPPKKPKNHCRPPTNKTAQAIQARLHEVHTEDGDCFAWTWKFRGERACGEKRDVNRSKTQAIVR